MKILMVYPDFENTFWGFKRILRLLGKKASFPPLRLLTIGAMLPSHWVKKLADMNTDKLEEKDIQWADSASLALLHYLSRAINNTERILIIATFRSEELTVDKEGYSHPLIETLRMMKREDLFIEIKLSNLTKDTVSKLAKNMIGGSLQEEFSERLLKESRGNALFVVESLRMLSEQKSLIQKNNQWRLVVREIDIPNKIRDIILRRLSALKYAQRRVLAGLLARYSQRSRLWRRQGERAGV